MPSWLDTAARILFGVSVAGFGVLLLLFWGYVLLKSRLRTAKLLSTLVVLPGLLFIDSGSGYAAYGDETPRVIVAEAAADAPSRLFMLFHGYNGSGQSLIDILGPDLVPYGTAVAFESGPEGYDNDEILALARKVIAERHPTELVLFGESFGGMVVMDLLRQDQTLHPRGIVFSATPSSAGNIKSGGSLFDVFDVEILLHGGLFSTTLIRLQQAWDLRTVPVPEPGSDEQARQNAYERRRTVTGPVFSDELRYIANFRPPHPGEFTWRTDTARYLRAPSTSDSLVKTTASATVLRDAFVGIDFEEVAVSEWSPDLHAPTPERPRPLIKALLASIKP
jgi:pimeloyl-ACP methyl ester carboxylesterase